MRVLYFGDRYTEERKYWLTQLAPNLEPYFYTPDDIRYLSRSEDEFDILFVSGNDIKRVIMAIRDYRPCIGNRAVIAVTTNSLPQDRARLLSAGYDDVFDIVKLHQIEATARIETIWHRYKLRQEEFLEKQHYRSLVRKISNFSNLNKKEKLILERFSIILVRTRMI